MAPEFRALIDGSRDAVRRVIADLREKAETAEHLRAAEHRAFMAEQREALASLIRSAEAKLAAVRDGVNGKDGKDGSDGRNGIDGAPGKHGEAGLPGRDGERGADGVAARNGKDGAPGRDGVDGKDGVDGSPGKDGSDGAPGQSGADGKDGAPGRDGVDGKDGVDGSPGKDGQPGRDGDVGPQGKSGTNGRDGADGADAYPGEARGLFDPDASYRAMDVVSFNGSEWRAKHDDPGELPGAGWMLSASRGKRGDRGVDGQRGKDGSAIVAAYVDDGEMRLTLTRDDGTELSADLYGLAQTIRAAANRDGGPR